MIGMGWHQLILGKPEEKKRKMKRATLLCFCMIMIPQVALASPIMRSEATDVDYSNFFNSPSDFGALDVGINIVSGSAGGRLDARDVWTATLGSSLSITSIQLAITNYTGNGTGGYLFRNVARTTLSSATFRANTTFDPIVLSVGTFPLGEGSYLFDLSAGQQANYDWQWNVEVASAPVPEPSTILLCSTGLLGLAGYRWAKGRHERTQAG